MTKKLYDDPWRFETVSAVTACVPVRDGFAASTGATVFFPGGGGQTFDTGTLGGLPVSRVYEADGDVWHVVPAPVAPGTEVLLRIDAAARRAAAETHTGEHVLSGLALALFGARNVGFHMGRDFATADFDAVLSDEQLAGLERAVNDALRADAPVAVSYPGEEELAALPLRKRPETDEPLRVVAAGEVDLCACCGTHVRRLGEVGVLKILSGERLRGGTRVSFVCGGAAVARMADEHRALTEIARGFSAKLPDAPEHCRRQAEELAAAHRRAAELTARLAALTAQSLYAGAGQDAAGERRIRAELEDAALLLPTAEALTALGRCHALLTAGGRYVLAASPDSRCDLKAEHDALRAAGARGGGRDLLYSGRL